MLFLLFYFSIVQIFFMHFSRIVFSDIGGGLPLCSVSSSYLRHMEAIFFKFFFLVSWIWSFVNNNLNITVLRSAGLFFCTCAIYWPKISLSPSTECNSKDTFCSMNKILYIHFHYLSSRVPFLKLCRDRRGI